MNVSFSSSAAFKLRRLDPKQSDQEHPIGGLLSAGVKVCVCTDNTLFSAVTASSEYALAKSLPGVGAVGLAQLLVNGHSARFVRRVASTA